ncbi:MAG TPA: hypothetical protein VK864_20790, partial [Longimicrobiales bacterium]|nr:hypothetical protein [Longimicrobiales bacterium]
MADNVVQNRRAHPRGRFGVFKDALYSMLRWIARHVRGFYGALAAFVSVSLIVGIIAVAVFVAFARLVMEGVTQ